jgi:hypothetical protein
VSQAVLRSGLFESLAAPFVPEALERPAFQGILPKAGRASSGQRMRLVGEGL